MAVETLLLLFGIWLGPTWYGQIAITMAFWPVQWTLMTVFWFEIPITTSGKLMPPTVIVVQPSLPEPDSITEWCLQKDREYHTAQNRVALTGPTQTWQVVPPQKLTVGASRKRLGVSNG